MPDAGYRQVTLGEAQTLAEAALAAHGASPAHAHSTARSIVAAQAEGNEAVGFSHLIDYCEALRAGRVNGLAEPVVERPSTVVFRIDACEGFPHLGVDRTWADFAHATTAEGIAILCLRNGFTCGALGYFARRLADDHGLAGLVAANAGPAVMPAGGGRRKVFCTNPLAFSMPSSDGESVVVDQSSAAGAFVAIRDAAAGGRAIPEGWALDGRGNPTTDAAEALEGVLLPFGGHRGANIALVVELLAGGLTGANWSHRAPAFNAGGASPRVGVTIIAIAPAVTDGPDHGEHTKTLLDFIRAEEGTHIPGPRKKACAEVAKEQGVAVSLQILDRVLRLSNRAS